MLREEMAWVEEIARKIAREEIAKAETAKPLPPPEEGKGIIAVVVEPEE